MTVAPDSTVDIPTWLEMVAVVAGALAGSSRAVKESLAVSGVVALAVAGGLGGGIIRDVLLQAGTPVAFTDSWLLVVAMLAALPALLLAPLVRTLRWPMEAVGALSLGIYSVLGADKALLLDLPPAGAILIGVISGTGGSVLADLSVGVPPALFRPGKLQGIASAFGTVVFVLGAYYTDARVAFFLAGVVIATAARLISVVTDLRDPSADRLASGSERVLKTGSRKLKQLPIPKPHPSWPRRGAGDGRGSAPPPDDPV